MRCWMRARSVRDLHSRSCYLCGPRIAARILQAGGLADITRAFHQSRKKLGGRAWGDTARAGRRVCIAGLEPSLLTGALERLGLWGACAALSALCILSIVGDLFESLLKRQAGVKDSSALLPG